MRPLQVVAIIEAYSVTGPAKNLIRFASLARNPHPALPSVALHVLSYVRGPGPHSNAFLSALSAVGIPFTLVHESGPVDPAVPTQLRAALANLHPDIVQTHSVKSHFLLRLAGLDRRYPWIAFHHGYTSENFKVRLYNYLDRWSLRSARRLVTVCTPFAAELHAKGVALSRIEVLPNSIESAPAPSSAAPFGLSSTDNVILHIGRFSSEKNHLGLLDAFDLLAANCPELAPHLVLVGDGVDRARIEARAALSPHAERIHFGGQQKDVWPYLRLARILTLPSLSEGSPNVILEAMAAGLPIAASSVGGIPDLVPHNLAALLTPPGDTPALARSFETLLRDPALAHRLGSQALDRVALFTPDAYRARLTAIYESLLLSQPRTTNPISLPTTSQS